jgi:AcrR family transcriptional regulator
MPRRPVSAGSVLDAALAVFAQRGFVRAKMSDIASTAGVSIGSLYNVAKSKEALFAAVFVPPAERTALSLPLPDPDLDAMQVLVTERMLQATSLPQHQAALLTDKAVDIRAELIALLEERYDAMAANWPLVAAIERTADDLPAVFDAFYASGREHFLQSLGEYLRLRADAGQLRLAAGELVVARFIVEAVAFWAYHRHEDPTATYTDSQSRQVCTSMLLTALLT